MQVPHIARTEAILAHIGLYRISLRVVLEARFFEGRSCGNVIQRLVSQQRLVSRPGLGRSLSYYQLTLSEARRRNLPQDRGRPLGPRALATHLAVLWFTFMRDAKRRRLEDADIAATFGDLPSGCPHVAESKPKKRIFRIHVVSPATRVPDLVKRLRAEIDAARQHPELDKWLSVDRYTFGLLTDPVRVKSIHDGIQAAAQKGRLPRRPPIICEGVPSPATIQEVIRDVKKHTNAIRNQ